MANNTVRTASDAGVKNETEAATATYTKFNLSAVTFVHPPSPPNIKQCPCETLATPQASQKGNEFIHVYHTEPSVYAYNRDSWLVRETRYSNEKGWHAPNDDLVADDAAPGSPVAAVGWWLEKQESGPEVWETRVYYIDKAGNIRERTNRTSFGPAGITDNFDFALPELAELTPPKPGWALTSLANDAREAAPNTVPFPKTTPLRGSKISALKVDGGILEVFYQAPDGSIQGLEYSQGNAIWTAETKTVVEAGKAKAGTPLTALVGSWCEHRLFYVTPDNKLAGAYGDAHTGWREIETLPYHLAPSAMISAVAWNYATNFFEIRVYTTDDKDGLYEMSYSRHLDGWKPHAESVAPVLGPAFKAPTPGNHDSPPLSAVAAVLLEGDCKTKVYFHPRRTIGEWDVCAKAPSFGGIPKVSPSAAERRDLEEKARVTLIKKEEERRRKVEEEERKRKAEEEERQKKAEEEERKRKAEEEERKKKAEEEERKKREEEQRRGQPQPKPAPALMLNNPIVVMGDLTSAPRDLDDEYVRVGLPFDINFYGRVTKTIWITDNGIICLDADKSGQYYTKELSFKYKDARRLPVAEEDFSKHALFPLWADLKICKGRKHGVFHQVSGAAPARTLTVEWLVTKYRAEDDYYHFSASLEEARPGTVTFKYNAIDGSAGSKCTVGVQGGGHHIQYSYNDSPQKIRPGLQLEFDTTKGTCTTKHFTTTARG